MVRKVVLAAFAASVLGGVAVATPASACDYYNFCAYTGHDFNGDRFMRDYRVSDWPSYIDDGENSAWHNGSSSAPVRVYDSTAYSDPHYCVYKGHRVTLPDNKDNDGQSHQWISGLTGCF